MTSPTPADEDLEPLVRAAQSGDEQALSRLLERCHRRVYRWALVRTGDADDADDVAQTVLVRLSSHLHRYDGRSRFATRLYRVTANASGGFFRQRAAARQMADRLQHETSNGETAAVDPIDQRTSKGLCGSCSASRAIGCSPRPSPEAWREVASGSK